MGLFDAFRFRKKKAEAASEPENLQSLDGAEPEELTPPETRYTQEYQDFLAEQEAGELSDDTPAEEE